MPAEFFLAGHAMAADCTVVMEVHSDDWLLVIGIGKRFGCGCM